MTTSITIALAGYAILAVIAILDKKILTQSPGGSAVYTFYSTIFFVPLFIFLPFFAIPNGVHIIWAMISGLAFGFGMWTMFLALKEGEASHISPFVGAVVALATYILSYFILNQSLNDSQKIGLVILVFSSLLISFERSQTHNGFHKGFVWGIFSGILFAFSHVSAKYIYEIYPFITGLVWTKSSIGIVGLFVFLLPDVHKEIFSKKIKPENSEIAAKKRNSLFIVISDKVLSVVAVLLIQYAIALGNVTVVNALAGLQYVLMFVTIYLLTKLRPKIFSEYFTGREIAVEVSAILLVVVGMIFLS